MRVANGGTVKVLGNNKAKIGLSTESQIISAYSLTRSTASINEGSTVTFTLATTGIANGASIPYVVTGISAADLVSGSLTGNFIVNNSSASITLTAANDLTTEGNETLTLSAANQIATVLISDTSLTPIIESDPGYPYTLSRSVASVNEGSTVVYTISSPFFTPGTIIPYTIGGISQEDLSYGSLTGNFVIGNTNTASLSFTTTTDLLTEGSEVMTLTAIENASSVTINDTSVTPEYPASYILTRSTASTNEGDYVIFTLSSVNVPQGTVIPYKVTGISPEDLISGSLESAFMIGQDDMSSTTFILAQDLLTEGTEVMTISAANRTASISVSDTSLSPQYTIARSASATDEGTTVTYTLSSDTALDGTLVPYTITGINAADLTAGSLTGNFTVVSKTASVSFTLANDLKIEGPETMTISAGGKTSSILINDTSKSPVYSLSRSAASTNEGTTVTYTLSTLRVEEGYGVPYKITGLSAEDLSSGSLEGVFVVDGAGMSTLSFTLANDELTEGTETMTLSAGNKTSAISILDTSKTPVYTLNRSTATANEGQTVVYTLATTNVSNGTQVPYTITGISQEDLSDGSLTGYFTINSNTASISATLANDVLTEGTETITITVNTSVGDRTQTTVVNDTSKTLYKLTTPEPILITPDQNTLTYTLSSTTDLNGSSISYVLSGIEDQYLTSGSLQGSFNFTSNESTIFFGIDSSLSSVMTVLLSTTVASSNLVRVIPKASQKTILLLNGDTEAIGSSNIIDASGTTTLSQAPAYTGVGKVYISSTKKYGSGSLEFLRNNATYDSSLTGNLNPYLTTASNNAFRLSSNVCTVEFWLMRSAVSYTRRIILANGSFADKGICVGFDSGGANKLTAKLNGYSTSIGGVNPVSLYSSNAIPANEWCHIAISGYPGSYKLFVNGTQTGNTYTGTVNLAGSSILYIGTEPGSSSYGIGGFANNPFYLDDLRIVQNAALYTSNFAPPTQELTINV